MDAGTIPAKNNAVTPIVLATAHEETAAATNQKTYLPRSNGLEVPTSQRSSSHAAICSNVVPIAISIAASTPGALEGSVKKLARNAPKATPGHNRGPNSRNAANATPEGGHTGEAFVPGNWSINPTRAAA